MENLNQAFEGTPWWQWIVAAAVLAFSSMFWLMHARGAHYKHVLRAPVDDDPWLRCLGVRREPNIPSHGTFRGLILFGLGVPVAAVIALEWHP